MPKELLEPEIKNIIHADIGAVVVKEWYNLDDEICDAVRYHTIGHAPMSLLDKIIFIADKVARENLSEEQEEVKNASYVDIDKAMVLCIKNGEKILESKGKKQHSETAKLLKMLLEK